MSETTLKEIKSKMYDINYFKYPKYSIINNIKITNLNIFSKIFSRNKILVYGNYDIVITYNNIIYNNYTTKDLVKYNKSYFHKVLHYDISKFALMKNLKSKIELLSKVIPIYSLRRFPYYGFENYNLCKIILFMPISVNLYKKESSTQYSDINFDTSQDISTKNKNLNKDVVSSDNTVLIEDKTTIKNNIPVIEESSYFNAINNDTYISTELSPLRPNDVPSIQPYNIIVHPNNKSHKIPKKTLIDGNLIIGKGYSKIFLEKTITLLEPIKPIWKITKVMTTADVSKIDISGEKAFASGFAYIDVNYKTLHSSDINTINGCIQYIHLSVPFSLCIDLVTDYSYKIKNSDNCEAINIYSSEVHNLTKPTTIDNETIYNEFTCQFIVQFNVLVTRNMELYI